VRRRSLHVLAPALSLLFGGCAGHTATRGGVVEVMFRTKEAVAQSKVAADCGSTLLSRMAPNHVRYTFTAEPAQSLSCLRRHELVRAAAQPL